MEELDRVAAKRICDIVAVAVDDIDSVAVAVEDGIAYLEGVVPTDEDRRAIVSAAGQVAGLRRVISCLATEHTLSSPLEMKGSVNVAPTVLMHYFFSLS